jgi:transcriptional regulator with XRE-family HTH domain
MAAGLPQDRLGVAAGLDEGSASARISRYESGIHEPPFSFVLRLSVALRVPAAYFYATDDQLAELILAFGLTPNLKRDSLLAVLSAHAAAL